MSFWITLSAFGPKRWFPNDQSRLGKAMNERAMATLVDLSRQIVSFVGSYAALAFFLKPEDRIRFALLGIGTLSATAGCRALSHTFHYYHEDLTGEKRKSFLKRAEQIAYVASHLFMATFYVMTISRLVHELGRAITSLALFNNSNPTIKIDFWSNRTDIVPSDLTPIGKKIGWLYATALFKFSGSLFVLAHDCSLIHYAHDNINKDQSGSIQAYFRVFLSSLRVFLPLIPLGQKDNSFKRIDELLGLHPAALAISLVAAPVLYEFALYASDRLHQEYVQKILDPND